MNHKHLMLKGTIHHAPFPGEVGYVDEWIKKFVKDQGMEIAGGPIISYVLDEGNRGMTAACLIKTSHIAFHIWDEKNPPVIQFDFYTCGEMKEESVVECIDSGFGLKEYEVKVLDRSENLNG
jgi:S-adenosylmethionine/arginine decarboxylase-like enzyme